MAVAWSGLIQHGTGLHPLGCDGGTLALYAVMAARGPQPAPEADKAAAPAPAVTAETNDDAIQEESPATAPSSGGKPGSGAAAAPAPEVEVQRFRRGRPVAVFRSQLGGYMQDQLEVGDILEQHGLKSVFAFDPVAHKRGVAIRFNPRNSRSLLTYAPGFTIFLDGEPKPITKMVIGVAAMSVVAAVLLKEAKMP